MFKQIANIAQMMKQAQALQGKFQELKARLEQIRVTGSAGGGLVEVDAAGDQRVVAVRIQPDAVARGSEALEQLIVTATNQALDLAKQAAAEVMQSATGDLGGLGDLFPNLGGPN